MKMKTYLSDWESSKSEERERKKSNHWKTAHTPNRVEPNREIILISIIV